jgi:hypothetical protein
LREEILDKNFPYSLTGITSEHIPKGGYEFIWEYLPDTLKSMLFRTFRGGESFEAIEWYEAVTAYKDSLSAHEYEDEEAYKAFPKMDYKATDPNPIVKPRFSTTFGQSSSESVSPFKAVTDPKPSTPTYTPTQNSYANKYYIDTTIEKKDTKKTEQKPDNKNDGGLFGIFKNRR